MFEIFWEIKVNIYKNCSSRSFKEIWFQHWNKKSISLVR